MFDLMIFFFLNTKLNKYVVKATVQFWIFIQKVSCIVALCRVYMYTKICLQSHEIKKHLKCPFTDGQHVHKSAPEISLFINGDIQILSGRQTITTTFVYSLNTLNSSVASAIEC